MEPVQKIPVVSEFNDFIENLKLPENAELICANDEVYVRLKLTDGSEKIFKANKS